MKLSILTLSLALLLGLLGGQLSAQTIEVEEGGEDTATLDEATPGVDPSQEETALRKSSLKFFTADHAVFRYDEQRLQLEVFALIDRGYLLVEPHEDGVRARYEITFQIRNDRDSLLIGDSWVRTDYSASDQSRSSGQKIPELIRYVVGPGTYRVAVRVVDLVALVYSFEDFKVKVDPIPSDELTISDIIFASRIEKTEDDVGEFDHNGLLVLPNADRMFGSTNPQVFYYAEIYNLTNEPGARYTVRREVLNDKREVKKPLEPRDREVMASDVTDVDGFNIGTLQTGTYILQLIVTDEATGITSTAERTFWVYRPGEAERLALRVDPGEELSALSDAEVEHELRTIRYLMTDRVRARADQMRDPTARRAFLARFWMANDPDTTTTINESRVEYIRRLEIVNQRFGTMQREGWTTDRGRVYLLNGEPSYIDDHPFDSEFGKSYQIWEYHQLEGGVIFVFVDRNNYGEYMQVHSTKRGELNNPSWVQLELR